jgi:hypothetical protein
MFLMIFFAFPFGHDQPTEIWALAKLRFLFKPRKRIWDQSGVKELVTITAPKKIVRVFTDGLSQTEVQSRLKALASTIDSRGWAIKNVNIDNYTPNPLVRPSSDRLLDINTVPNAVPDTAVLASDDILDEQHNPIAQQFDNMIERSTQLYRQQLVAQMNTSPAAQSSATALAATPWFLMGDGSSQQTIPQVAAASDDAALSAQIHNRNNSRHASYGNLRTLKPVDPTKPMPAALPTASQAVPQQAATAMTTPTHPVILALANNDDLNVSTIAREANKAQGKRSGNNEVVISLH